MSLSLFAILMIIVVVLVAFFHWLQGFFSGTISAVLAVFSAVIALSYHETVVESLLGGKIADSAHAMVLVMLFAITYLVLRSISDKLVPGNVSMPAMADRLGGGVTGLIAGVFTAGILAVAAQEMSLFPSVMGYARFEVEPLREVAVPDQRKSLDRTLHDLLTAENISGTPQRMMIPVDDVLVETVRHLSDGGSLSSRPLTDVHPDWLSELFGQRLGIEPAAKRVLLNLPAKNLRDVIARPEGQPTIQADAGVYAIDSVPQKDAEFGVLRNTTPKPTSQPAVSDARTMLAVVRVYFSRNAADKGGARLVRFSPGSVRLAAFAPNPVGEGLTLKNYYPIGTLEDAKVLYTNKLDDFLFVNDEAGREAGGDPGVDLVFRVERAGFLADHNERDPAKQTVREGTFLEFKRLAREDLSGLKVRRDLKDNRAVTVLRKPDIVNPPPAAGARPGAPVPPPPPPPSAASGDEIQGKWQEIAEEVDGDKAPAADVTAASRVLQIDANTWTVTSKDADPSRATITLDATQSPKHININAPAAGNRLVMLQGIYVIEGDVLKVCVGIPGKSDRPTSFAEGQKGKILRVFRRVK